MSSKKSSTFGLIVTKDASKEYHRGREVVIAVKNVSLEIKEGEFLAVVGPSGCGKTTLLNLLSGLDSPSSGKVILDGVDTTVIDERLFPKLRREKVGFVFQDFNLIQDMTAVENVMAPLLPTDMKTKDIETKAMEMLRAVDLLERKDHRARELSGGEMQRVAIARALVNKPKVIFADEPTGNLDSKTGKDILDLMKTLNEEQGTTIVLVTHNEELRQYASRIIHMHDGKIE
ncbi:MAG: ABC transporter ATP-binding protein [Promethearchaeati archaeon SRVP18_Atabeyarchaeia-1]